MTTSHLHCGRRAAPVPLRRVAVPLAFFLLLTLAACATMPPDRIAYNSIEGATVGVQSAVKAWGDLYAQGKYTDTDRAKVESAYKKFQASALVAVDIAKTATDPNAKTNALAYVNAAAGDILRLLRELEVIK